MNRQYHWTICTEKAATSDHYSDAWYSTIILTNNYPEGFLSLAASDFYSVHHVVKQITIETIKLSCLAAVFITKIALARFHDGDGYYLYHAINAFGLQQGKCYVF